MGEPDQGEVKAVARAICFAGGGDPDERFHGDPPSWQLAIDEAKAAIQALNAYRTANQFAEPSRCDNPVDPGESKGSQGDDRMVAGSPGSPPQGDPIALRRWTVGCDEVMIVLTRRPNDDDMVALNEAIRAFVGSLSARTATGVGEDKGGAPSLRTPVEGRAKAIDALYRADVSDTGWRPIETAPRDGTRFIAGRWEGRAWCVEVAWFSTWFDRDRTPQNGHDLMCNAGRGLNPSRWQPLPASPPPKAGA